MLSKEFFSFFTRLEKNNNKEWFDLHRSEYEQNVKEPFRHLVQMVIERIRKIEPDLQMEAKDAIFRINRDVRFSTDKSPYKAHMGAHISRFGRKAIGRPGFYFEVGAKGGGVAGGCYDLDKESLLLVRDLIKHESKEFTKLINAKSFVTTYGEIRGQKNKVLPPEFRAASEQSPILYNKQFYWWTDIPVKTFLTSSCIDVLMSYHKAAKPLSDFLQKAFE
jgi:uncharacterized protein (TIGR02453 family)